jgi:hypothetical protein
MTVVRRVSEQGHLCGISSSRTVVVSALWVLAVKLVEWHRSWKWIAVFDMTGVPCRRVERNV